MMTLRETREKLGISLEMIASETHIPINDLCDMEMTSTAYAAIVARYIEGNKSLPRDNHK